MITKLSQITNISDFETYVQREKYVAYGKELAGVADYLRSLSLENSVGLLLPMVFLTWRLRSIIGPGDIGYVDEISNLAQFSAFKFEVVF